ncbi:MAG: glycosyltransferase family 4 protein [Planctomycetota bacterium]
MRVAHVITRMIVGGAQENTLFNCRDLVEMYGDDVLLVTGPALGPEGDLLLAGGGRLPFAVAEVPSLRRSIHPWRDLASYRAVKRILRDFRPDVVHTHSAKGGVIGRLAAWSLGVPAIIHTVHGAPFHPYQHRWAKTPIQWAERFAARRCHALVSVADAMTELLVDAQVAPREKFITIHSGMDVEPFLAADRWREETRRELGFRPDEVVIGKIARLFHLKGHEFVLEAAPRIVAACPQVRFLFVGDGVLRGELERRAASVGLSDHFRFTGLVPPSRIPALVGAMDILVHASLREGLARALPQALIAGKPAVSFDVDGAREVVISGETGWLVPPLAVDQLANSLIRLAESPADRVRLGEQGRARFTDQFRHETMTRRLRELYGRILTGGKVGSR